MALSTNLLVLCYLYEIRSSFLRHLLSNVYSPRRDGKQSPPLVETVLRCKPNVMVSISFAFEMSVCLSVGKVFFLVPAITSLCLQCSFGQWRWKCDGRRVFHASSPRSESELKVD